MKPALFAVILFDIIMSSVGVFVLVENNALKAGTDGIGLLILVCVQPVILLIVIIAMQSAIDTHTMYYGRKNALNGSRTNNQ
jgi:uncharacterized membrane protein